MNRALARLRGLILRRAEKGFDEELELHLRLLAERFERQGMTPAQAESAARRQFGNCTQLKEVRKEMGSIVSLESFWQDIRFGARALRRSPGVTGVIILTLMLGIGANAALFSVIYAVLLRPLPFHDPGRLVMLSERRFQAAPDVVSAVDFEFWRTHARSF